MSLYVSLHSSDDEVLYSSNITSNLSTMADNAGMFEILWRPYELGENIVAKDIIETLRNGINLLESEPERFDLFDAKNGWGRRKDFDLAMQIAMDRHKTHGYKVDHNILILYWCDPERKEGYQKLPYEMNTDQTIEFVWGWLNSTVPTGKEPDHDGSNGKGFHIWNDAWNRVGDDAYTFIAIEPEWAWYGK